MRTDLSELFKKLSVLHNGHYDPFPKIEADYDRYLAIIRNSRSSRLHTRVKKANDLWSNARIGVILSDALIISGSGPSGLNNEVRVVISNLVMGPGSPLRYFHPEVLAALGHKRPALTFFADDVIAEWLNDAAAFIEDGRLLYLPERAKVTVPKDNSEVKLNVDSIDKSMLEEDWNTIIQADQEKSVALIPANIQKSSMHVADEWINVINVALPFINGISLKLLHQVLTDEEDTLIEFRKTVSSVLPTYISSTTRIENPEELSKIGFEIRRDLIEPEIAKINKSLKKITQVRAIKVAGATVTTVGLSMAAISNGNLMHSLALMLGAGGIGAIANEYANYRAEMLSLKENPWHFAWRLKQTANQ